MQKLKLPLILFACISIFATCKKEQENTLPPATQVGANTFGCKINGKVFIPKGSSGTGTPNPHVQYDFDLNGQPYLSIDASDYNTSSGGGVFLVYRELSSVGFYPIVNLLKFSLGWPAVLGNCGGQTLDTMSIFAGGGIITKLDIPNHIISGTFDFKYKTLQCDTVNVTDGRFDIKF